MIQAQTIAPAREQASAASAATLPPPTAFDFLAVFAVALIVSLVGWFAWKWTRNRPTRGLKRAVRQAKQTNERMEDAATPHQAPEMEMRRREESTPPTERSPFQPDEPATRRRRAPREERPVELTPEDEDAMRRLRALLSEPDAKDIRVDYRRLDAFVRRYLYERYNVKTFSQSATALLDALPQDLTQGVVDYVGEIVRVCELAELPAHRPSRSEFRQLAKLAEQMIANHSRAATGRFGAMDGD